MPMTDQVWIVDDDSSIRWVMEKALSRAGLNCRAFEAGDEVLDALTLEEPMVVVSDIRMPGMDGITLLAKLKSQLPDLPVIITTAHSDLDSAVNSYEEGAFEYLPKPFDIEEMVATVTRAQSQRTEHGQVDEDQGSNPSAEIIGNAPAMQEVFRAIGRLAQSHITVLINGESGTGKELVARALHRHSPRADNAFVALNMAAIPQELMESELFGHEKGAFTGANSRREGRFEQARGGTLFLDEIGDMPMPLQAKLLRFLQERVVDRVGSVNPIPVDVRVVCATHRDVRQLIADGLFREDLYYRISEITLEVPALRERDGDALVIAQSLLKTLGKQVERPNLSFSEDAISAIGRYEWPGNVREMINKVKRATIMADGKRVSARDLELDTPASDSGHHLNLRQVREQAERQAIETALQTSAYNMAQAARLLGITRPTLYNLTDKYRIRTTSDAS